MSEQATGSDNGQACTGVLVMAHGTPSSLDELPAFVESIRHGRPLAPEQMAALRARYQAIGGCSPLAGITRSQVEGISRALQARRPGKFVVALGAKHLSPSIEDAVGSLVAAGTGHLLGVVLAPQFSAASVAEYERRALAARSAPGGNRQARIDVVASWHLLPGFVSALARNLRTALDQLPRRSRESALVLFSAHSVPQRLIDEGDPYARQVAETAEAVAALAGIERYEVVFQSAGMTPDPWLGPDIREAIRSGARGGAMAVVACPVGFVADHLEVLYDLDVEAAAVAREEGVSFARSASLNADPELLEALADLIIAAEEARPGDEP